MILGKTIRIFLSDSTVSGIRHGEIVNWTGQALACPRTRFQELREWNEVKKPGVYFLFGVNDETGEDAVYIGEAEVVIERLLSHYADKAFWSDVVTFTSKDDNLTKAHVKYLESRLISIANEVDRYLVINSNQPQIPTLPRSDRDAMEEYIESVRMLLGVLGYKLLEPLFGGDTKSLEPRQVAMPFAALPSDDSLTTVHTQSNYSILKLAVSGIAARATPTDEGLVVMEGSEAALVVHSSLSGGYRAVREKLIETGVLKLDGSKYKFAKNQLFSSPSQAAAVIVGYAINGRENWKTQDGKTYAENERTNIDGSLERFFGEYENK